MIRRLRSKDIYTVIDFINNVKDYCLDFYITIKRDRIFINNIKLIEKLLKTQEMYGNFNNGSLKSIFMIYREKGFRPYLKILAKKEDYLLIFNFIKWQFENIDLYFKIKKYHFLSKKIKEYGFISIGDRGKELLFCKNKLKIIKKIISKD